MDGRLFKVFTACFAGGGIGALIALGIHPYFWWVGLLAGFAIGYFSYEFKEALRAISIAFRVACREVIGIPALAVSPKFRSGLLRAILTYLISPSLAASLSAAFFILHTYAPLVVDEYAASGDIWISIFVGTGSAILFLSFLSSFMWVYIYNRGINANVPTNARIAKIVFWISPVGLVVAVLFGVGLIIVKTPKIAKFCAMFAKTLFIAIHSNVRLLCGADALIGAGLGYFFGNPILGALIGGAVGIANFELLSRRVFKLVPQK